MNKLALIILLALLLTGCKSAIKKTIVYALNPDVAVATLLDTAMHSTIQTWDTRYGQARLYKVRGVDLSSMHIQGVKEPFKTKLDRVEGYKVFQLNDLDIIMLKGLYKGKPTYRPFIISKRRAVAGKGFSENAFFVPGPQNKYLFAIEPTTDYFNPNIIRIGERGADRPSPLSKMRRHEAQYLSDLIYDKPQAPEAPTVVSKPNKAGKAQTVSYKPKGSPKARKAAVPAVVLKPVDDNDSWETITFEDPVEPSEPTVVNLTE